MKKILKLQKMGMDFYKEATEKSDCGNFRLRSVETLTAKDGTVFGVDFARGTRYEFYKKNGKRLEKPKVITEWNLHADTWTYKQDESGNEICVHYRKAEQEAWSGNYLYTKADILRYVNTFCKDEYSDIEII